MSTDTQGAIRHVVIVGGGTAGWLTAGLIAAEHGGEGPGSLDVTLIESPDVRTIGVGEGTWPTMRTTLRTLGIPESVFLTACNASFKQGTRFDGWVHGGDGDRYYHPFTPPAGYGTINLVGHWQKQRQQMGFADAVCVQGYLCDRNLAPKQAATPEYASVVNYAYHLDAGAFAGLLYRHCTEKLGVRHLSDHVTGVVGAPDGDIRALQTATTGEVAGDLFVDCSGFAAMLLGGHYGVPFVDRRDVLFNDTALAAQVPYAEPQGPIASQTIGTARQAGWIWDIGLVNRRGVGYVYSSAHTSDAQAERVLRDYLGPAAVADFRKLGFRPGHRQSFWHRNCVAVGLSAGFLEPLEASALVLVELSGKMLAEQMPARREVMDTVARRFNDRFRYHWDRIVEFLKLHYVLSRRENSDYWRDNRRPATIPERLSEHLALWRHAPPWHGDFPQREEIFSSASYQYVLYGMGFESVGEATPRQAAAARRAADLIAANQRQAMRYIRDLPDNRQLLQAIAARGLPAAIPGKAV